MDFSALSKPFYAEKVPDPGDQKIVTAAENMFTKIMCAPKTASQEEVEREAGPSGTTRGWKADTDRPDCCVQCKDDPERVHWLLFC